MSSVVATSGKDNGLVPFCGRNVVVPISEPQYAAAIRKLVKTSESVTQLAASNGGDSWKALAAEVNSLTNYFMDSDRRIRRFQIELVTDGLLPYLGGLGGRLHVDKQRFLQIGRIIRTIQASEQEHPASILIGVDEIVSEIRRGSQFHIWKSELLTTLEAATEKQWQPIIADNKRMLQDYGGKLLVLGLIGVVGWPVAFLYPLYRLSITLLGIIQEWEHHRKLSNQSLFDLAKTIAMLIAATQVLSILAVYASVGHTCLALGGAAIVVSMNNALIKKAAPIMAPHLAQLDQLMTAVGKVDISKLVGQHSRTGLGVGGTARAGATAARSTEPIVSDRVQELPDEPDESRPTAARKGLGTVKGGNKAGGTSSTRSRSPSPTELSRDDDGGLNEPSSPVGFASGLRRRF